MPSKLGQAIRKARNEKELGLRELARRIKKSASLLSSLENAATPPPVAEETLRSIEDALELEPYVLVILAGRTPEVVAPADPLDVALYREMKGRSKKDRQALLDELRSEKK